MLKLIQFLLSIGKKKIHVLKFNQVPLLQHVGIVRPDGTICHVYRRL